MAEEATAAMAAVTVEDTEVLSEAVESVVCHWCNSAGGVEELPADE